MRRYDEKPLEFGKLELFRKCRSTDHRRLPSIAKSSRGG